MNSEALTNLDEGTRLVDSWFALHKQYTFITLVKTGAYASEKDYADPPLRRPSR
jgi:hypothetical protein